VSDTTTRPPTRADVPGPGRTATSDRRTTNRLSRATITTRTNDRGELSGQIPPDLHAYIEALVDSAPPLSASQQVRLRELLTLPGRGVPEPRTAKRSYAA
jgi:hypothetical protein